MSNIVKRILGIFLLLSPLPILVFIYANDGVALGEAIKGVARGLALALVMVGLVMAGLKLIYE